MCHVGEGFNPSRLKVVNVGEDFTPSRLSVNVEKRFILARLSVNVGDGFTPSRKITNNNERK